MARRMSIVDLRRAYQKAVIAAGGRPGRDTSVHGEVVIEAVAPHGLVWADGGVHVLQAVGEYGPGARGILYAELIARLAAGTVPCGEPDCELCVAAGAAGAS
jgi:hypothetical protein